MPTLVPSPAPWADPFATASFTPADRVAKIVDGKPVQPAQRRRFDGLVFAIDPGTESSGWCLYAGAQGIRGAVLNSGTMGNADLLRNIGDVGQLATPTLLAIEMVASYGMPVGREVFETVRWIGRFQQAWKDPEAVRLVPRSKVKAALRIDSKSNDAGIRKALIVLLGLEPVDVSRISTHAWAALGVAVAAFDAVNAPRQLGMGL